MAGYSLTHGQSGKPKKFLMQSMPQEQKMKRIKAAEASRIAGETKQRRQQARAISNAKARVAEIDREKKRRADFYTELLSYAQEAIKEAVKEGKKSTTISMWPSGRTRDQGRLQLEEHGYKDLIKKVERLLRRDGYKVTHEIEENENIINWEAYGPDSYETTYHAYIRVSW
jgi:hypothetical protein